MLGKRKAFRVRRSFYVKWALLGGALRGEGKVTNISLSGISMEIYTPYEPPLGQKMLVEAFVKDMTIPEPRRAEVVWVKKLLGGMKGVECGLKFLEKE